MTTPRPKQHLTQAGKMYPQIWQKMDHLRSQKGIELRDWPDWCFAPVGLCIHALTNDDPREQSIELQVAINRLTALYSWRLTQGIYRFDASIYAAIQETPLDVDLPVDALMRLPEHCVYIEAPMADAENNFIVHGFFAQTIYNFRNNSAELKITFDTEKNNSAESEAASDYLTLDLSFSSGRKLKDIIERSVKQKTQEILELRNQPYSKDDTSNLNSWLDILYRTLLPKAIPLVLYLCAENAEMRPSHGHFRLPAKPKGKKTKKGMRFFPPNQPTVWETGWDTGPKLRQALERRPGDPELNDKRPHIRKAHWHHFWTGSRKNPESRKLVLRWLQPVAVNIKNGEELLPTVRNVAG